MADAGKLTVKLVLDTSEFYPALERVREAMRQLGIDQAPKPDVAALAGSLQVFAETLGD